MKLDLTGIVDDGGFVNLNPGRYTVETKSPWSVSKSKSNDKNLVLRVPFTVLEKGEYEGAPSSYFHTIMSDGAADKLRTNKLYTLRLLSSLGIITNEDRGEKGELEIELEYGDKNEFGSIEVLSIKVNGDRRGLGGINATAVSVIDSNRESGVSIKSLEANGTPQAAPKPESAPAQPEKKTGGFPF